MLKIRSVPKRRRVYVKYCPSTISIHQTFAAAAAEFDGLLIGGKTSAARRSAARRPAAVHRHFIGRAVLVTMIVL
jgi:hypothetical protein